MTELKPCPFCGGEAEFYSYGGGGYGVSCTKCRCDVFSSWFHEEEAIEEWNTRHERTCVMRYRLSSNTHVCSECGERTLDEQKHLGGLNYCPNCGAKVVE